MGSKPPSGLQAANSLACCCAFKQQLEASRQSSSWHGEQSTKQVATKTTVQGLDEKLDNPSTFLTKKTQHLPSRHAIHHELSLLQHICHMYVATTTRVTSRPKEAVRNVQSAIPTSQMTCWDWKNTWATIHKSTFYSRDHGAHLFGLTVIKFRG